MHRKTSKNESKNSQPSYDAELEAVKKLAAELEKNERYPLRKKTLISYSDNDNKNFRSDKKKKKRRAKQPAILDLEQQPVEVTEYDEHNNEVDVTKYDGHDNEGEETTHNNRLIKIDDDGSDSNPVVAELAPEDDIKIQEFHIPKNPEGLPQIIPMPSQSTETMMDLSFLKPMQPVNIFPIQHPNIFLTPTPAYCNIPFHSQELKFPFNPLSGYLSPPITQFNMGYVTPHNLYQDILNRKFQKQNTMNILFNNLIQWQQTDLNKFKAFLYMFKVIKETSTLAEATNTIFANFAGGISYQHVFPDFIRMHFGLTYTQLKQEQGFMEQISNYFNLEYVASANEDFRQFYFRIKLKNDISPALLQQTQKTPLLRKNMFLPAESNTTTTTTITPFPSMMAQQVTLIPTQILSAKIHEERRKEIARIVIVFYRVHRNKRMNTDAIRILATRLNLSLNEYKEYLKNILHLKVTGFKPKQKFTLQDPYRPDLENISMDNLKDYDISYQETAATVFIYEVSAENKTLIDTFYKKHRTFNKTTTEELLFASSAKSKGTPIIKIENEIERKSLQRNEIAAIIGVFYKNHKIKIKKTRSIGELADRYNMSYNDYISYISGLGIDIHRMETGGDIDRYQSLSKQYEMSLKISLDDDGSQHIIVSDQKSEAELYKAPLKEHQAKTGKKRKLTEDDLSSKIKEEELAPPSPKRAKTDENITEENTTVAPSLPPVPLTPSSPHIKLNLFSKNTSLIKSKQQYIPEKEELSKTPMQGYHSE